MRFFGSRPNTPTPTPSLQHPWDSHTRLIDLTSNGDWLTLGDMFTGLAVFGASGSGKTSSLASLASWLMELDCGFVWLCAKPDEVHLVHRIARAAGREEDIVVIGEDIDGTLTPHCFNPLEYETSISTTGTGAVVTYLSDCAKVLSRKDGEKSGGEGERFWTDQFDRLLRYCIDTAKLAGSTLSVDLLRTIQLSAPTSLDQLASDAWAETSVCWQCLSAALSRAEKGEVPEVDVQRVLDFWTKDYLQFAEKTRSIINVMFAVLGDAFYAEEPIRSILTGTTTITPEDVIKRGKIVVLSLPTNIYYGAGRMAQFCFKYSFQRAMLRRRKPADGSPMRPTVLWVDEAHNFAHPFDSQYFREVRSNRGINVYLEQGIGGYINAMNLPNADAVDDYLQNLTTKFFFQNNSPQTNEFAANAIGKLLIDKSTSSWGHSMGGANIGDSTTLEQRHQIISGQFGFLARGGVQSHNIVSGYVLRPHLFNATGTNVALCKFQQTNLTQ